MASPGAWYSAGCARNRRSGLAISASWKARRTFLAMSPSSAARGASREKGSTPEITNFQRRVKRRVFFPLANKEIRKEKEKKASLSVEELETPGATHRILLVEGFYYRGFLPSTCCNEYWLRRESPLHRVLPHSLSFQRPPPLSELAKHLESK